MSIDETILKAVEALKFDALKLRTAAQRQQRDAAATPVIHGFLRRTEQVSQDFADGIATATAALQCPR